MELFTKLFGSLPVFVYHGFDRIVIHGYLSGLSRPEQVVYFFRRGCPRQLHEMERGEYRDRKHKEVLRQQSELQPPPA